MSDAHRVIVILEEPERNPYELWLLAALLLSSILFLVGLAPTPNSLQRSLPYSSIFLWNLQVATGTAAILIGMFWKLPVVGRTIQIAGHLWVATGALIYACVLFYYNGLQATMAGLIVGGIVVAALTRSIQLRRQISKVIQKIGEQHGSGQLGDISGGD